MEASYVAYTYMEYKLYPAWFQRYCFVVLYPVGASLIHLHIMMKPFAHLAGSVKTYSKQV